MFGIITFFSLSAIAVGIVLLAEDSIMPPLFKNFSIAHRTFLKKKFGDENSIVALRWVGVFLMTTGILALSYLVSADGLLIMFFAVGVYSTFASAYTIFTKRGLDWQYEKQWQSDPRLQWPLSENDVRIFDRVRALRGFFIGLTCLLFSITALFKLI